MTYRNHNQCNYLCISFKLILRYVRRVKWIRCSKPLGQIELGSYGAVKKHFSSGGY